MRVKPYRICDICGEPYNRESGCLHVTAKETEREWCFPWEYKWRIWDLCPRCQNNMYFYLRRHCKEEEDER